MHPSSDLVELKARTAQATSFAELLPIALRELEKFTEPAEVVCGPITTGGRGSIGENLEAFESTIICLTHRGRPIFNQIPYEDKIFEFRTKWQSLPGNTGTYYRPILDEFYLPLFKTKIIQRGFFLPGYESSIGAMWERETLTRLGADIVDLNYRWVSTIINDPRVDPFQPMKDFWADAGANISKLYPGHYCAIVGETMDQLYGKDYNDVRKRFPPLMPWGLTVLGIQIPP